MAVTTKPNPETVGPVSAGPDEPPDIFHLITLGDRILFCAHAARTTEKALAAELAHWRAQLGDAVGYEYADAGADLGLAAVAVAIYQLETQGTGVSAQLLKDLGLNPALVDRHFQQAKAEVRAAAQRLPANVVRLRG